MSTKMGLLCNLMRAKIQAREIREELKAVSRKIDHLILERDALLKIAAEYSSCDTCKFMSTPAAEDCRGECAKCELTCGCRGCSRGSKWEWKGV